VVAWAAWLGGRGIGIGTIVIALIGGWAFGINPLTILGLLSGGGAPTAQVQQQAPAHKPPADDRMARFVSTVLADTEDVWTDIFAKGGAKYQDPRLVLFRGATPTACGTGQAAMGPFYCPADRKVYIDLGFYETLKNKLGAPGEFAQAYVIAHEVGHHVQNLMGISARMEQMRAKVSPAQYNALSVRLELQADCFAGVWANHAQNARQILENGDIESAMNACPAEAKPGLCGARKLHARHQCPAHPLVQQRDAERQRQGLRHLQHEESVINDPIPSSGSHLMLLKA
jgi:predicted metalloprotease